MFSGCFAQGRATRTENMQILDVVSEQAPTSAGSSRQNQTLPDDNELFIDLFNLFFQENRILALDIDCKSTSTLCQSTDHCFSIMKLM
jgi:hypothetical protein